MLSIFFIGVALSMDAFSVALSFGLSRLEKNKGLLLVLSISLFHFFMPLIGNILGQAVLNIINIDSHLLVTIIFVYLAIQMYLDEKKDKNYIIESLISVLLVSFSVSIDSFSVGIGLSGLTDHNYLSYILFSMCSGSITYGGLIIGKYINKCTKMKNSHLGSMILLIIAIVNMCKMLCD